MTPECQKGRASDVAREYRHRALCGGMSAITFAQRLADAYHALTDVPDRVIEFHIGATADGQLRAMKLNAKTVERICDGTIRFPLDLMDAWAAALPSGLDLEFRRALAQRLGFVGVLPPSADGASADIATMVTEFGQTMQALAPLAADGRFDAADCPALIRKALREGTEFVAAWLSLQQALIAALPDAARSGVKA